jgi:lipopolysaccharide/colanic/teichoic acid biosynthesis glycosyltransferase
LTGLAQISGRGELTREEKLDLDVTYVEKAGFWLDCKIIMATMGHVFMRRNIYEKQYSQTEHTRGQAEQRDPDQGSPR